MKSKFKLDGPDLKKIAWVALLALSSLVGCSKSGGGGGSTNNAPSITSDGGDTTAAVSIQEHHITVTTVTATDEDEDALTFSISGGDDESSFRIDSSTGGLLFGKGKAPDYENPSDSDGDNTYQVEVEVSDGSATATQVITVTVGNNAEWAFDLTKLKYDSASNKVYFDGNDNDTLDLNSSDNCDVDENGTYDLDEDFEASAPPGLFDGTIKLCLPKKLIQYLDTVYEDSDSFFDTYATVEEVEEFWSIREMARSISSAATAGVLSSSFKSILFYSKLDHDLAWFPEDPQHTHVYYAYALLRDNDIWARLNPDREYVKDIFPEVPSAFVEQEALVAKSTLLSTMHSGAAPDATNSYWKYLTASVMELADRTQNGDDSTNLTARLYSVSGTVITNEFHQLSTDGGDIWFRIFFPTDPDDYRYEANGAPVLVYSPGSTDSMKLGGDGKTKLGNIDEVVRQGFVVIIYHFPGFSASGSVDTSVVPSRESPGTFDIRGAEGIAALRDVVKFALGTQSTTEEKSIQDIVPGALATNVGMMGFSNGGNVSWAALELHGSEIAGENGVQWYVGYESPTDNEFRVVGRIDGDPNSINDGRSTSFDTDDGFNPHAGTWSE